jgi:hypothetical protein
MEKKNWIVAISIVLLIGTVAYFATAAAPSNLDALSSFTYLKISEVANASSSFRADKVTFTDINSGTSYSTEFSKEGVGRLNVNGKEFYVKINCNYNTRTLPCASKCSVSFYGRTGGILGGSVENACPGDYVAVR